MSSGAAACVGVQEHTGEALWVAASDAPIRTPGIDFRIKRNQRLRALVFGRDDFSCRACGWRPATVPQDYDGRYTVGTWPHPTEERTLQLDHILPRCNGGLSVAWNLQTLCASCNARKSGRG